MSDSGATTGMGNKRGKANLQTKGVLWFRFTEPSVPVIYPGSGAQPEDESAVPARVLARRTCVGEIGFYKNELGWATKQKPVCSGINEMRMWWQDV